MRMWWIDGWNRGITKISNIWRRRQSTIQISPRRLIVSLNCAYKTAQNMIYCMSFVCGWPLHTDLWFVWLCDGQICDSGSIGAQNGGYGAWTGNRVYQFGGRDELCWWQHGVFNVWTECLLSVVMTRIDVPYQGITVACDECSVLWWFIYCTQSVRAILIDLIPLVRFDFYPLCLWLSGSILALHLVSFNEKFGE